MTASVATVRPNTEVLRPPATAPNRAAKTGKAWVFNSWIDLIFLANVLWPVLAVAVLFGDTTVNLTVSWWRLYMLLAPHRWITLVLVFFDPEAFRQRPRTFVSLAVGSVLFCAGVFLAGMCLGPGRFDAIVLLVSIDFVWNAWHYASQHAGIFRIYGRTAYPDHASKGTVEKLALRVFLLYVLMRLVCLTLPQVSGMHLDYLKPLGPWLVPLDWAMLLLPLALVVRELIHFRASGTGRLAYLLSVSTLYGLLLWSANLYQRSGEEAYGSLVTALAIAVSIFHGTEYLTIVTWAATRKRNPQGILGYLVPRWAFFLFVFMVVLGISGALMNTYFATAWLLLNLAVSFLHYAYDGLIWKARKPAARPAVPA